VIAYLVIVLAAILIGLLVHWELIVCEGVHLGPRVVVWLYDRFAPRYDGVKRFDETDESYYVATPLMEALCDAAGLPATAQSSLAPFVLDVATGTARVPLALLREPAFNGRVVALDLSRDMLAQAIPKLAPYAGRATLVHHTAVPLPFPDETFDAVTCLEALEFLPEVRAALHECARVLRPGGVLFVTRRRARALLGHVQSQAEFEDLVTGAGLIRVESRRWQYDYDQVWARKPGNLARAGVRPLVEVLRCARCGAAALAETESALTCAQCGAQVRVGADGIIPMAAADSPQPSSPP
jgi:ubiquinone/menaquinone biosynthesis C-methylase UbiE